MKPKTIICLIALSAFSLNAQEKKIDQTPALVSRGTFFVGLNSNLAFGFVVPEGRFIFPTQFRPKIGYFIFDRLSLSLSYQGIAYTNGISRSRTHIFHNGEFEVNHYFYARKNVLLYSLAGLAVEQYSPRGYRSPDKVSINLKVGAGVSFRPKRLPNLGLNVEAAYYLGPYMRTQVQKFPNITFGISYSFHRKKPPVKKSLVD